MIKKELNYLNYLGKKWNDIRQLKRILVCYNFDNKLWTKFNISCVKFVKFTNKKKERYNIKFLKFDSIETVK